MRETGRYVRYAKIGRFVTQHNCSGRRLNGKPKAVHAHALGRGGAQRYHRCEQTGEDAMAAYGHRHAGHQPARPPATGLVPAQDRSSAAEDEGAQAQCDAPPGRDQHHLHHGILPSFDRASHRGADSRVGRTGTVCSWTRGRSGPALVGERLRIVFRFSRDR